MTAETTNLLTSGAIATQLGVSPGAVSKAIKALGLVPAAKKGVCCLYSKDAVAKVKASLK